MKKGLIYSALVLSIGSIFAKFVGILLKVPLINIVGDYGIGLYQLPYPIYTTILTFSMTGFSLAVAKFISTYNPERDYKAISATFYMSLITITIFSFVFSLLYVIAAKRIIAIFKWPPEVLFPYLALAPALFVVSVQSAYRGYFNGIKKMYITSISQILESIGRVGFGLVLCIILLARGVSLSVAGALLGASLGALVSLAFLYAAFKKQQMHLNKNLQPLFRESLPIARRIIILTFYFSLSSFLMSAISITDSLFFPYFMSMRHYPNRFTSELFGIFSGKAMTLIHVPLTFSISMAISIISYMSSAKTLSEKKELIAQGLEYVLLINVPCVAAFFFFPDIIINLVFFNSPTGGEVLRLSSLITLVISLVQFSTSVLQGLGKFLVPVKSILIAIVIKIACMFVFIVIYNLNIAGCILANLVCYTVIFLVNFLELKNQNINAFSVNKLLYIVISSAIMVITGSLIIRLLTESSNIVQGSVLVIGCIAVYTIFLFIFRVLKFSNLKQLITR
ncbi:polysaccharide biosynthesis protein [Caldicellulosiruptor changbaiensis]|uniref:Polysaccharide biosynthesis protein n=1 Tax=Caldicellulosiruptor changbaiensis TaxID=1222016 RepID=A0A3T0D5M1_9FIRM|nr:polysaccharide biosynthesis protein [Caldicellulosiruptor changbaiensis]